MGLGLGSRARRALCEERLEEGGMMYAMRLRLLKVVYFDFSCENPITDGR